MNAIILRLFLKAGKLFLQKDFFFFCLWQKLKIWNTEKQKPREENRTRAELPVCKPWDPLPYPIPSGRYL